MTPMTTLSHIRPTASDIGAGPSGGAPADASDPSGRQRFMSEADCRDLLARLARVAQGGGHTAVKIYSTWTGNVRWARNQVSTSGEVRTNTVRVFRNINGASNANAPVSINDISTPALIAAARRAERLARLDVERPQTDLVARFPVESLTAPHMFSEATYQLDADRREAAAVQLAQVTEAAGMLSAGYIEVSAHSLAILDTFGRVWYFPYTSAQYSVTVRDPKGTGSGWAGMDYYDWAKIDAPKLSRIALDKCLASRNAVKIEPGRYTTIMEPQAVCDFAGYLVWSHVLEREWAEDLVSSGEGPSPFLKTPNDRGKGKPGFSQLGEKVIDERLSISADPMDPELGFPPFDINNGGQNKFDAPVYHAATWIEHGVLTNLEYSRGYGVSWLGRDTGLPESGALRMSVSGPTNTIEEMIAATKRGLLVTRFDQVFMVNRPSQLCQGRTRDGLWLIENGKISKPVKNLYFTESILFALNNVEQVGVPQRVFHPQVPSWLYPINPMPAVVPPLKIRDFSFTAVDDAV